MISREGLHPLSFICYGSESFRPEEQLMSAEGEIFPLTVCEANKTQGAHKQRNLIQESSVARILCLGWILSIYNLNSVERGKKHGWLKFDFSMVKT